VTLRSFRKDGDLEARASQHGILCGEVLHTLAPEAELLLANWEPNDAPSFLDAIRWARQEGAAIITCSVIVPSWSDGEGGGEVNQAIARIVGDGKQPGDVLLFASAGNLAERHWCGRFRPNAHGRHQWVDGQTRNGLTPWATDRVAVELYGPGADECELQVRDAQTGQLVEDNTPGDTPIDHQRAVRFTPQPRHKYVITLQGRKDATITKQPFHLVALGGALVYSSSRSSIACPADGPGALAIGAVDSRGQRLSYSSCGPNSPLPKPDFVAAVPFPSSWREQPFSGTSAAAPQAAGIAAVVWSGHHDWTAHQVRDALRRSAVDLGPPGHDCDTGYGLIRLR
jgi:subtilisin family serine protease